MRLYRGLALDQMDEENEMEKIVDNLDDFLFNREDTASLLGRAVRMELRKNLQMEGKDIPEKWGKF